MNRYGRGGSRATNTTLCQKCLQRGHYSYECKAAAQERPYASRPSRTQQFKNPKLAPKLTNTALEEPLPKNIASNPHARRMGEELRNPSVDHMDGLQASRKRSRSHSRSRSVSSYSSVSTISTRSSRSPSTSQRMRNHDQDGGREKRRRRASSTSLPGPHVEDETAHSGSGRERNTRLRRQSNSPAARGRRRSRSTTSDQRQRRSSPLEAEQRTANRRTQPREDEPVLIGQDCIQGSYHREMGDSHAVKQPNPPDQDHDRQRSLSPYSKRISLTRDSR